MMVVASCSFCLRIVIYDFTLETPRLVMRHNESNPARLTTGHKDTPPIWMDRTLRLYGLIKEFLGNYNSFHRTAPLPHTLSRLLDL